jgi:tryptophan-rich sensory protein
MKLMDIIGMVFAVVICLSVGAIGTISTSQNIPTWYASLNKPAFTPPNWLFGPAWTTLYILMGIAAFLVWKAGIGRPEVKAALWIFLAQLVLNAVWTPLFFGAHWLLLSFLEMILLWLLILWTIVKFYGISVVAGLLLIPYILWVSFASVLNLSFWLLNR